MQRSYATMKKRHKKKNFDEFPIETIRNMGIIAHVDAGKTTTAERMLYLAGEITHMGDVDEGNTTMDFLELERERGITIQSAAISFIWNECRVNMIDTPGHVDFQGEVERSVRVLDGAVAILDAVKGVQAQTHTIWRQADRYGVPRIVYFNKMDRDDASIERGMQSLEERLGVDNLLCLQIPIGAAEFFSGMIDIVEKKAYNYPKTNEIDPSISDVKPGHAYYEKMMKAREELLSKLADHDDRVIEAYSEFGDDLDSSIVHDAIRRLTAEMKAIPVLCGSSFKKKGIQPLMEAITRYLPSPVDRPPIVAHDYIIDGRAQLKTTTVVEPNITEPLSALAFKVVHDLKRGNMVYVRVYRGSFHCGMKLYNLNRHMGERVIALMRIGAEHMTAINSIKVGDICALIGMKNVHTGDTLITSGSIKKFKRKPVPILPGVQVPPPVFTCAVEAKDEAKEAHLLNSLENLCKEDPSVQYSTDRETGQLLISGMGELHLDIIKDRLLNHYNVDAWVGKMRVSYRSTIQEVLEKEFEYTYELTGSKQRASVWLRLEPLVVEGDIGESRFLNLVPEDSMLDVPPDKIGELKDALREGVENVFRCGPLFSFPLHGIRATIRDIEYYEDSTPSAFRSCVSKMIKDMLKETKLILLQPIMEVEVSVPADHFGNILSDLSNVRRGNISAVDEGINTKEKIISAEVPLRAMVGYSTAVRSLSQGTASFSMDFLRYGELSTTEAEAVEKEYRGL